MSPELLILTGWIGVACGVLAITFACGDGRALAWTFGVASLFFLVPSLIWMYFLLVGG